MKATPKARQTKRQRGSAPQVAPVEQEASQGENAAQTRAEIERAAFLAQVERSGGFVLDCRLEVVFYTGRDGEVKIRRKKPLRPVGRRRPAKATP